MNIATSKGVETTGGSLVTGLHTVHQPNPCDSDLSYLWNKVRQADMAAFETLHSSLYPPLFSYACFILPDAEIADRIIADVFVNFWNNRLKINPGDLKISFAAHTRSAVIEHLSRKSDTLSGCNSNRVYASTLNCLVFKGNEIGFLANNLNLSEQAIGQIVQN